jgi:hypothetical protein
VFRSVLSLRIEVYERASGSISVSKPAGKDGSIGGQNT